MWIVGCWLLLVFSFACAGLGVCAWLLVFLVLVG